MSDNFLQSFLLRFSMNARITTSAAVITTATVANTAIITLTTMMDVDPGNRSASKVVGPGDVALS